MVLASLSLHYFPWPQTEEIVTRIRCALRASGRAVVPAEFDQRSQLWRERTRADRTELLPGQRQTQTVFDAGHCPAVFGRLGRGFQRRTDDVEIRQTESRLGGRRAMPGIVKRPCALVCFVVAVTACSSPQKEISDVGLAADDLNIAQANPQSAEPGAPAAFVLPADQSCEALTADIARWTRCSAPTSTRRIDDDPGSSNAVRQRSAARRWACSRPRRGRGAAATLGAQTVGRGAVFEEGPGCDGGGTVRRSFLKGIRFARGCSAIH